MMRDRLSSESGFTLVELLIAMVLFLVILGASLTTFERFQANARLSERRNDASQEIRLMIDSLKRDLRNLADPTTEALSIERDEADDLVFRSVDPAATGIDPTASAFVAFATASIVPTASSTARRSAGRRWPRPPCPPRARVERQTPGRRASPPAHASTGSSRGSSPTRARRRRRLATSSSTTARRRTR